MASQNQGMTIAVIVFVILTVISMAIAVVFVKSSSELEVKLKAAEKAAADADNAAYTTAGELNELKQIVTPQPSADQLLDSAAMKKKFQDDLAKYGARLKLIETNTESIPATYSQMLDSAFAVLEQRNTALQSAAAQVTAVNQQKTELEAKFLADVAQYKEQTDAALKEKADVQSKLASVEEQLKKTQVDSIGITEKCEQEKQVIRAENTKQVEERDAKIVQLEGTVKKLQEHIDTVIKPSTAATYDGLVKKINATTRTVWINLGAYDNLPKHLSFSDQDRTVPEGSTVPPKAKIEVTQILGDHLAEARIIEDDMRNPILEGDNIFTLMWNPGQRTRFAFAGKIDLDDNGSDDMDQVRSLVARAGGSIDAEIVNGEIRGALNLDTRYLVLGAVPADKAGADAYNRMLEEAERLGIQRVPMSVFFDQVGYKREARTVQFGGGSGQAGALEPIDGGPRVSNGGVSGVYTNGSSNIFAPRRPPSAAGSATSSGGSTPRGAIPGGGAYYKF